MANSKIYVPGQNDFLDWAKKMNKNAELDMRKAKQQAQGAVSRDNTPVANSQTSVGASGGTVGREFDNEQGK